MWSHRKSTKLVFLLCLFLYLCISLFLVMSCLHSIYECLLFFFLYKLAKFGMYNVTKLGSWLWNIKVTSKTSLPLLLFLYLFILIRKKTMMTTATTNCRFIFTRHTFDTMDVFNKNSYFYIFDGFISELSS